MIARKMANSMLLTIFIVMIASFPLIAKGQASVGGHWEGDIAIFNTNLGIIIDFHNDQQGNYIGKIDIPLQGAKDLPLTNIRVSGDSVSFSLPDAPGNAAFSGIVSGDGNTISGDFTQGGQRFDFKIMRENPQETAKRDALVPENLAKIEHFCDSMLTVWNPPGFAIGIVYDGKMIFAKGFGFRNLKDSLPADSKTLYAIGSTTKAFTTMLMGMLVDSGKLDWNAKVIDYLPDFRLMDEYATCHITPLDLATHRSGLPRHDICWYGSSYGRKELYDRLRYLQFSKELRQEFQYNNLMYMTAGYLAEQITGESWENLIKQRIFEPLEMTGSNTSVLISQKSDDFALPYQKAGDSLKEIPFRMIDNVSPAGAINSNVEEMCNWLMLHLKKGKFNGKQLISQTELERMHNPQMVGTAGSPYPELSFPTYGLGWLIQYYRGHRLIWHDGGIDGFYTKVGMFPDEGLGIVAFVNQVDNKVLDVVTFYIADLFLGLEPLDWNSRIKGLGVEQDESNQPEKPEEERVKGTHPSHDLQAYAGDYEHPAYGDFKITLQGKQLSASLHDLGTSLEHWHYDVFRCTDDLWEGSKIHFLTNKRGDVDRLAVQLEPTVDDIIFAKNPDARLSDPRFLSLLVGNYDLKGTICTVELRGENTLFVTVPGQSPYQMVPYKGTEFNLKDLHGFSVRFDVDEKSQEVLGLSFIQPNGVFEAKRVKNQ